MSAADAAPAAAGPRPGRLFYDAVRPRVYLRLRVRGKSVKDAKALVAGLTDHMIDQAVAAHPEAAVAIGDGTFLHKLVEFFETPLGQAILAALAKLLLGL